jgi:G protein-coupled receptor GPR1
MADVAIFMIALHSALYIFRSSRSKGEAGLYRHRYIAYAVWLIWPSLAASLAFLGSSTAYVSGNVSCSLPVRPYWFRLALSWVPRYSILLGIAGIYLAIYIYVRHKFKNFNATSDGLGMANYSGVSAAQPAGQLDGMELSNVNITPPGPIVGSHHGSRSGSDAEGCAPHSGPSWENYAFGRHEPLHHPSNPAFAVDPSGSKRPSVASDLSSGRSGSRKNYSVAEALQSHRFDSSAPEFLRGSIVASSLQQASLNDSVGGIPAPYGANPTAELDNQALASESLTRRYRAVRGQLRLLWVYPFVYMIIWTIPFVNHCLNYNDNYAKNPNFGLVTASTIGLALQCAANALMFSIKEKPWNRRHGTVQTTTALGKRPWRGDRQP